jgi:hypothetical protein
MLILNNASEIIASGGKLLINKDLRGIYIMMVKISVYIIELLVSRLSSVI